MSFEVALKSLLNCRYPSCQYAHCVYILLIIIQVAKPFDLYSFEHSLIDYVVSFHKWLSLWYIGDWIYMLFDQFILHIGFIKALVLWFKSLVWIVSYNTWYWFWFVCLVLKLWHNFWLREWFIHLPKVLIDWLKWHICNTYALWIE